MKLKIDLENRHKIAIQWTQTSRKAIAYILCDRSILNAMSSTFQCDRNEKVFIPIAYILDLSHLFYAMGPISQNRTAMSQWTQGLTSRYIAL